MPLFYVHNTEISALTMADYVHHLYQWKTAVCCVNMQTLCFVDVVTLSEASHTMRCLREVFGFTVTDWNFRLLAPSNKTCLHFLHVITGFQGCAHDIKIGNIMHVDLKQKKWSNIIKVEQLKRRLAYPWGQERRISDTESSSFVCVKEFQCQTISLVMQLGTS